MDNFFIVQLKTDENAGTKRNLLSPSLLKRKSVRSIPDDCPQIDSQVDNIFRQYDSNSNGIELLDSLRQYSNSKRNKKFKKNKDSVKLQLTDFKRKQQQLHHNFKQKQLKLQKLIQQTTDKQQKQLKKQKKSLAQSLFQQIQKVILKLFCKKKADQDEDQKIKIKKTSWIIKPDQTCKIIYDLFCIFLIWYEILMVPFQLSFDQYFYLDPALQQFSIALDFIFIFDIFLNFNTAIYLKGLLIVNRKKIIKNYLKLWFWIDLLSSFPYSLIAYNIQDDQETGSDFGSGAQFLKLIRILRFIKVMRLLRIAKLKILFKKISQILNIGNTGSAILEFVKIILFIFLLAHWLTCSFHAVGRVENENSWIVGQGLENGSLWEVYINSFYWSITTMITVGYGDITPLNEKEKMFVVLAIIVGCAVFSYSLNMIGKSLADFSEQQTQRNRDLQAVNRYLKAKQISMDLQIKVRKYLDYIWNESISNINEDILSRNLTTQLQQKLKIDVNLLILQEQLVFFFNYSDALYARTLLLFRECFMNPDDMIINVLFPAYDSYQESQDEYQDTALYYLYKGEVQVYLQKYQLEIKSLSGHQVFGDVGFILNRRQASVKSVNFTSLLYIRRQDFLEVLSVQDDIERFHHLKDSIEFYSEYHRINVKCYLCNSTAHLQTDCNLWSQTNRISFLQKHSRKMHSFRRRFVRNHKRSKRKTLKILHQVEQSIDLFQMQNDVCIDQLYDFLEKSNCSVEQDHPQHSNSNPVSQRASLKNIYDKIEEDEVKHQVGFQNLVLKMLVVNNKIKTKNQDDFHEEKQGYQNFIHYSNVQEFEAIREYEYYFPHNNFSSITEHFPQDYRVN